MSAPSWTTAPESGLPDDVGDRAEGTDRRQPQDHRQHLEDQLLHVADAAEHGLALLAHRLQSEADDESSATNRVCSTLPAVSDDSSDVGMIDATKSIVPPTAWAFSASAAPVLAVSGVMSSPLPGLSMLPTTRPMPSATVDMPMKYARARPPTLPTLAAARTEPMPSTMVQKITG